MSCVTKEMVGNGNFNAALVSMEATIRTAVKKEGFCRLVSCDTNSFGWSDKGHSVLKKLALDRMDGIHIDMQWRHGMCEWEFTERKNKK